MCLLVQVIVLVLHYEGGVACATTALHNFAEWLLQSTADLDVSHASRCIRTRFVHLISLLCIIAPGDRAIRPHALLQHSILRMSRRAVRVGRVALPVRRVHLLERLHVSRQL